MEPLPLQKLVYGHLCHAGLGTGPRSLVAIAFADFSSGCWRAFKEVVNVRAKEVVAPRDVEKLRNEVQCHGADHGLLFVSNETLVPPEAMDLARLSGVSIRRIGWNGRILEEP